VIPIVLAYIKYYGVSFALRITALMFLTMVLAALVVDALFSGLGLIPDIHPTRAEIFGSVELDYKLVLNVIATVAFIGLMYLTWRRGTVSMCGVHHEGDHQAETEKADHAHHDPGDRNPPATDLIA